MPDLTETRKMNEKLDTLGDKVQEVRTSQVVQNEVFARHEAQQAKDFKQLDERLEDHETNNLARDKITNHEIDQIRADIAELKGIIYKAMGGMTVLLFVFQNWDKISRVFG